MDFKELERQGKTVIYMESTDKLTNTDWELWGERKTPDEHVYVYRKIVTFEEAEECYLSH